MQPTWQTPDGSIRLFLGDCRDVLPTLSGIDAVVTDPPYGIQGGKGGDSKDYGKGKYTASFSDDERYIEDVVVPAVRESLSVCSVAAITPGNRCLHLYPRARDVGCFWTPAGTTHGPWGFATFHPILFYGKDWRAGKGALPSGRAVTERAEKNGHPCPKPIAAWTWLVDKACIPQGTVLDPFMGSGTGAIACLHTNRRFVGIELDSTYFDIAVARIEAELAKQPLLEGVA